MHSIHNNTASKPMKIGYVFSSLLVGGCQTHFANLCEHFSQNHKVKYCVIKPEYTDPVIEKRLAGLESTGLHEMAEWADVLHFDLYNVFLENYKKVDPKKSIVTFPNPRESISFMKRIFKYRFPATFVSASQTVAEATKVNSKVIYCGVDTERLIPMPDIEKKYDVLILGRMRPIKNHKLFVDICKKGNFSFLAIGGTATHFTGHMNEIERMVRDAAIPGRDHVPGVVEDKDLINLINQAKVAVVTSHSEAAGFNALEPMSCGLPVVGKYHKGTKEAIGENGKCGFVVLNKMPIESYVDAINECLDNRVELGSNARERVCSIFSLQNSLTQFEKLYHSIYSNNEDLK